MSETGRVSAQCNELFFADGWRVSMTWLLALIFPFLIAVNLVRSMRSETGFGLPSEGEDVLVFAMALAFLAIWFCLVWGLAHRRRPVVAICGAEVEFGSIYRFARRPSLRIGDAVGVDPSLRPVRVRMRSGEVVSIGTAELSQRSRAAVREAFERRIGERSA